VNNEEPRGDDYLVGVADLIMSRREVCGESIKQAAELVGRCVADGGIIHLFGSGHSRLVAIDTAGRAATLTSSRSVNSEEWPGRVERFEGLGAVILRRTDLRSGEVVFVISNSGLNPLPIDVAIEAAAQGAKVVGIGSEAHSRAGTSKHSTGKRLLDVCDVFLDTGVPAGDALFQPHDTPPVGAGSTILAASLMHAVIVEATRWMRERDYDPPVRRSRNLPGGDEHNDALATRYQDRIPELRWT
jgi:uncharacterized phosphosugar-binding protein